MRKTALKTLLGFAAAFALFGSASAYPGNGAVMLIGSLTGANMNVTTDQAIAILPQVTKYRLDSIEVTACSGSVSLAAGGFYTSTSKGGTTLVAAAQVYSTLTGTTIVLQPTLAAAATQTAFTASTIYFSLTTGQGSAMTCNILVYGRDLTGF